MVVFYSAKGGMGCTVLTALVGVISARQGHHITLSSFDHDLGTVLAVNGVETRLGLRDWLSANGEQSADSLKQLALNVAHGLELIPAGMAAREQRHLPTLPESTLMIDASTHQVDFETQRKKILVTRPCILALKRAMSHQAKPDAVVLIDEPDRAIDQRDVEDVVERPVLARLNLHAAVARSVDAGQLVKLRHRAIRPVERVVEWIFHVD